MKKDFRLSGSPNLSSELLLLLLVFRYAFLPHRCCMISVYDPIFQYDTSSPLIGAIALARKLSFVSFSGASTLLLLECALVFVWSLHCGLWAQPCDPSGCCSVSSHDLSDSSRMKLRVHLWHRLLIPYYSGFELSTPGPSFFFRPLIP